MMYGYRWVTIISLVWLVGCGSKTTRIELTTYDENGTSRQHYAVFNRVSYRITPLGTLEVVLQSDRPSSIDPTQTITQIIYIRTFWRPKVGKTYAAESSQINARIKYAMLSPPTGARYDGAAFISYKLNKRTGKITGEIESATIAPRYRLGQAVEPFGPSRLTGAFVATENPGHVVNTLQLLETQFSKAQ